MYSTRTNPYEMGLSGSRALPYLRRVYALFSGGVLFAIAGALFALYGSTTPVETGAMVVEIPTAVAFGIQHPILCMIGYVGAFFAASSLRMRPGINVAALFGYTFVTGLFLAPALFVAQMSASQGGTISASPVRDAFLLSGAAFTGLTTYAFVTRKDFSFMAAGLSTGLWVVIGASLLGMFLNSSVFSLAIASVGVLLFAGFILYDTSRILRADDQSDPVGAALSLFLDVVNLFMSLLRILSASRRN